MYDVICILNNNFTIFVYRFGGRPELMEMSSFTYNIRQPRVCNARDVITMLSRYTYARFTAKDPAGNANYTAQAIWPKFRFNIAGVKSAHNTVYVTIGCAWIVAREYPGVRPRHVTSSSRLFVSYHVQVVASWLWKLNAPLSPPLILYTWVNHNNKVTAERPNTPFWYYQSSNVCHT